jgi:hypothetical protein
VSSCDCSERTEQALTELKSWKRAVEGELESQFERIRSIAGRVDRAKRKDREPEPPALEALQGGNENEDEQARLNRILCQRFHGG